jgi:hypothetical protein
MCPARVPAVSSGIYLTAPTVAAVFSAAAVSSTRSVAGTVRNAEVPCSSARERHRSGRVRVSQALAWTRKQPVPSCFAEGLPALHLICLRW